MSCSGSIYNADALCDKRESSELSRYLNSFPHMAMLSKTLTNAFNPVRNFSIMFL